MARDDNEGRWLMPLDDKRSFTKGRLNPVDTEDEDPPALAMHDAPADPVMKKVDELIQEHQVNLTSADILAAAGAEGLSASFVVAAADLLNRFAAVDREWMLDVVTARFPVSDAVVASSEAGELPVRYTPDEEGQHFTTLPGLINALLAHLGCEGFVMTRLGVDKDKTVVELTGFEAVFPGETDGGQE
jgi:hypothetical protein